jgi:DNA-binding transcriptional ArsR family regulator
VKPGSSPVSEQVAEELAATMFALSAPSRVRILGALLQGPHSVSQLAEAVGMEQSALSHQLRILRQRALVSVAREGRRRVYELYDPHVAALLHGALHHVDARSKSETARALQPAPAAR